MAWPGRGKCTAYPRPGQDGPPLGVRWFSEGLGLTARCGFGGDVEWGKVSVDVGQ